MEGIFPLCRLRFPSCWEGSMRIAKIDTFRVFAAFAVICIHVRPFYEFEGEIIHRFAVIIIQATRFAVPFFFIVSGYFFGKKLQAGSSISKVFSRYIWRLSTLFIAWSFIYLIIPTNLYPIKEFGVLRTAYSHFLTKINWISNNPIRFMLEGTCPHLWFVPSLMFSLTILAVFISLRIQYRVFYLAIILYLGGLIAGPYSCFFFGLDFLLTIPYKGPFVSLLFVVIGWWLSHEGRYSNPSCRIAYSIIILGFVIHIIEAYSLWKHYHACAYCCDYLVGTVFFAMGFVFLALAKNNDIGKSSYLARIGRLTLGIYMSQFLIIENIRPLKAFIYSPLWEILYPFATLSLSLFLTLILSKNSYCRRMVI